MKIKFKAIRFLPNRSQLSFFAKWLTKEVTAGLVVAAAIALATLWINNYQARQKEKLQLEKLHLGLSSQYIDSILGIPMVQFYDAHYDADISIYKQSNSVVWCAYDEEKTVAYVVIVKSIGRLYKVNSNIMMSEDAYLTQFTYSEFAAKSENIEFNIPANNDDYAYYSELYYGAGPADYNYFILGNYKSYFNEADFSKLLNCYWSEAPEIEVSSIRTYVTPNAFGMIKAGYEDIFSLVPLGEDLRTYNDALFGDWSD